MPKTIQVRNVPDDVHEEIAARVKARGPSKVKAENTVRYIRESRGDF